MTFEHRVAVAVAPNGGRRTKADHPKLPMTARELAATASACADAGAAMIHVHVRDGQGRHFLDAGAYRRATAAIREAVGDRLVVQITSESLGIHSPAEQIDVIRQTKPQAVSLARNRLAAFVNRPPAQLRQGRWETEVRFDTERLCTRSDGKCWFRIEVRK